MNGAATRRYAELTSGSVAALPAGAIVVQPIGAIEQHGPHLPLVTDALIAESVATAAVKQAAVPCWQLPTLAYGKSNEHLGFPGTISLSTETLLAVCRDVGRSLARSGIGKLVFVNGHGGQPCLLETAARDIRAETGLHVFTITPMRLGTPPGVQLSDTAFGIHGGELETSLMLALAPQLVRMELAALDSHEAARLFGGYRYLTLEGAIPTAWLTSDLCASGVLGDPRGATRATGEAVLAHWIAAVAGALAEIGTFAFPRGQAR